MHVTVNMTILGPNAQRSAHANSFIVCQNTAPKRETMPHALASQVAKKLNTEQHAEYSVTQYAWHCIMANTCAMTTGLRQ